MANQEKVFAKGFNFKRSDNAPEWVVGRLSLNAKEAIEFITKNVTGDWVNLNIAQGKTGNYYIELDTWKPSKQNEVKPMPQADGDDLPF